MQEVAAERKVKQQEAKSSMQAVNEKISVFGFVPINDAQQDKSVSFSQKLERRWRRELHVGTFGKSEFPRFHGTSGFHPPVSYLPGEAS